MIGRRRVFVALGIFLFLIIGFLFSDPVEWMKPVLKWMEVHPILGGIIFVAIYIIAPVFFFPVTLLTIASGILFGFIKGVTLVLVSAIASAVLTFWIGRYFRAEWLDLKAGDNRVFDALNQVVSEEGWKMVLPMRLFPFIPFAVLNYMYGMTRLSLKEYVLASGIGMLPGAVFFTMLGVLSGDLVKLFSGSVGNNKIEMSLTVAGFLVTLSVLIYLTLKAKKIIETKIDP